MDGGSIWSRLRYRFDNYMSRGGSSLFVILLAVFAVFVLAMFLLRLFLAAILPSGTSGGDAGVTESAIVAFLQTFDPGYMAGDLTASHWFMGAAVIAGVGGIILIAILIAFTNAALERRLRMLRKGKSRVFESCHTLILGWEPQRIVEIVEELAMANENTGGRCCRSDRRRAIVVLADEDKEHMDDYLARRTRDVKSVRVITRTGDPSLIANLEIVAASKAKSVMILSGCSYSANDVAKEQADAQTLKTLLALEHHIQQTTGREEGPRESRERRGSASECRTAAIVVDLFRSKARAAAGLVCRNSGAVVSLDLKGILARVLLQASRSVGLWEVYDELLSFRGAEIYITPVPGRDDGEAGTPREFRRMQALFDDAIPIGIQSGDTVHVNPGPDTPVGSGDGLIVVARSRPAVLEEETAHVVEDYPCPEPREERPCIDGDTGREGDGNDEGLLLIGWGPKTTRILDEYCRYAAPGSRVDIMMRSVEYTIAREREKSREYEKSKKRLEEYRRSFSGLEVLEMDPTDPETWRKVDPHSYGRIILLGDGDRDVSDDVVDSRTVTILLLLREALATPPGKCDGLPDAGTDPGSARRPTIVTELMQSDNRVIVPDVDVHDFVISNRIISMLFAQVAEDPRRHRIYREIFRQKGPEIYIKPASSYLEGLVRERGNGDESQKVRFGALMDVVAEQGEICIGVRTRPDDRTLPRRTILVPSRDDEIPLRSDDFVVVIGEQDRETHR